MIHERDQVIQQQQKIKEVIKVTCKEILDLHVQEKEPVEDKVTKLTLAVKGYKEMITTVQFKYEM